MTVEAIAKAQLDAYNAQDLDAHCACFADDVVVADLNAEPNLRGIEDYRARYVGLFAQFPQNRAEIIQGWQLGDTAVLHEKVYRSAEAEPFEVMSIYSFEGDKCSRVEFVR